MKLLLGTDKREDRFKGEERYIQKCGCQYTFITDKSGHAAVSWYDICADHWITGRR